MTRVARLRDEVSGTVLEPGDAGFDEARRVWNGMIDRRPVAIVRAAATADIASTVRRAVELDLPLAIRGGGHSVAGYGTVDGGIVLDLGDLTTVDVDPATRQVRVAPGATLAHVDRATEPHALAVPVGVVSATGVAGLTLGGGVGWLTRAHGLTVDNLLGAEVVTAAGETVVASPTEHDDLFWALRGGGGNFGVVSSFSFQAHPLGPGVLSGTFVYGAAHWRDALHGWARWAGAVPDAMTSIVTFVVPPPELELGTAPLMLLGWVWASPDRAAGEAAVAALLVAAPSDQAFTDPMSWTAWQSQADSLFPRGVRAYWKNTSFDHLDDATIDVIVRRGAEQTWRGTAFDIHHMGGAFGRVADAATPFPSRSAGYWLNIYGFWPDASEDAARIAFVRGFAADMAPHATGGQYVNFLGLEADGQGGRAAGAAATTAAATNAAISVYGPEKLQRLMAVKRRYDPGNVFRLNHNILPG
jgi:FAD/FMN-containing dehydrogenase